MLDNTTVTRIITAEDDELVEEHIRVEGPSQPHLQQVVQFDDLGLPEDAVDEEDDENLQQNKEGAQQQ